VIPALGGAARHNDLPCGMGLVGVVMRTSTRAKSQARLPFVHARAEMSWTYASEVWKLGSLVKCAGSGIVNPKPRLKDDGTHGRSEERSFVFVILGIASTGMSASRQFSDARSDFLPSAPRSRGLFEKSSRKGRPMGPFVSIIVANHVELETHRRTWI
jgi:hypothetical protein